LFYNYSLMLVLSHKNLLASRNFIVSKKIMTQKYPSTNSSTGTRRKRMKE